MGGFADEGLGGGGAGEEGVQKYFEGDDGGVFLVLLQFAEVADEPFLGAAAGQTDQVEGLLGVQLAAQPATHHSLIKDI